MANPKYAGLPGIAPPDEKDVYETDDLPEADQDGDYMDEVESENIERPHISIVDAHAKFKDKTLVCGKGVDFSDRFRRRRHMGYQTYGEWEIAEHGEKESIEQRYNRLQCEVREMLEDIAKLKADAVDAKNAEAVTSASFVPQLERSLNQLNSCLNLNDADLILCKSDTQADQIKKLMAKIELLQGSGSAAKLANSQTKSSNDSVLTYQLQSLPSHGQFLETARLADLEQRLSKLEGILGSFSDNLKRLQLAEMTSVCEATQELSARVSLLDASQVDRIDAKLSTVLAKMDIIAEKRGGQEWQDKEKKINELYDLLKKSEVLSQSIKPITERLIALKSLHADAGDFKKSLADLQTDQVNVTSNIAANQATLEKVRGDLKIHLETVTKNIQALDARLGKINNK